MTLNKTFIDKLYFERNSDDVKKNNSKKGKKVLTNNTIAILFPYLRSQLTLLTSQPEFEPIILPIMNINALMNDEDK